MSVSAKATKINNNFGLGVFSRHLGSRADHAARRETAPAAAPKNTAHFDKRAVFLCVYPCGCANVIR